MGRHTGNKNQNVSTEETVVKEDPKTVIAEETAEQTTEPETVPAVEESDKATEVTTDTNDTTDVSNGAEVSEGNNDQKVVSVICDKLYIRPEPNKKADIGVLIKGTELIVNDVDGKLPEGWLYVTVKDNPSIVGYVVAEYVK